MKYWIINNTKFGYKNNSKEWNQNMFDYFKNQFIPFIKKHSKPNDKLIHLGNIFNSSESVNIELLLNVQKLFIKLSSIIDIIILDGYNEKTNISSIFKNTYQGDDLINRINYSTNEFIPYNEKIIDNINNQKIIFLNNRIDKNILKKYSNTLFICGYYDDRLEEDNVIRVGALYQFEKTTSDKGFYVIDSKTLKYKFIKNSYSPIYKTIKITNISQLNDLDENFINNNKVKAIIDKKLIDEKKIKIDLLLSKYNFKSIEYINDDENEDGFVNNTTINIEELILDKMKNSDNEKLLSEFKKIMKIYKEKY